MGCTLAELGERMSGEELGLWIAYLDTQPFGSPAIEQAVALVLAAVANGPLRRRDKRDWRGTDFMVRDPWAAAPGPAPRRKAGKKDGGPTLAQLKAHFGRRGA